MPLLSPNVKSSCNPPLTIRLVVAVNWERQGRTWFNGNSPLRTWGCGVGTAGFAAAEVEHVASEIAAQQEAVLVAQPTLAFALVVEVVAASGEHLQG